METIKQMPRSHSEAASERQASEYKVLEQLFDDIPDIVFFVKDLAGRYVVVNRTLVDRCGLVRKDDVIGMTAAQVYPPPFGQIYVQQDEHVLRSGDPIKNKLELQLYRNGGTGWCLTNKSPIRRSNGEITGMVGVSRDLHISNARGEHFREVSLSVEFIHAHYADPLRIEDLAKMASLSVYQFEQRMKKIYHMTAGQFIVQTRVDAARLLLARSDMSIADVAARCGFCDQSALARQFKAVTGLTPSAYRRLRRAD